MTRAEQRRLRAEVIQQAKRCEQYAGEALALSDAGREGSAICLRFVVRLRSEAAFKAIAQLRAGGAL